MSFYIKIDVTIFTVIIIPAISKDIDMIFAKSLLRAICIRLSYGYLNIMTGILPSYLF